MQTFKEYMDCERIFSMDFISQISTMQDLEKAKDLATKRVESSKAQDESKEKARMIINGARNVSTLVKDLSNFNICHNHKSV